MIRSLTVATALIAAVSISAAHAGPTLDGSGFGAPSATVTYDPAALSGNFGAPGMTTNAASYDISVKSDASYGYVLVAENGGGVPAPGFFANLYFGTGSSATTTSDIGFEVTNSDVFSPGGPSMPVSTAGQGISFASLNAGTAIEFAVPFTYFETNPQNIDAANPGNPYTPTTAANPDIILRLSQSFGYSVAGGSSFGPDRLGLIVDPIGSTAVPEPASMAMLGVALAGLAITSRRRRQV